MTPAQACNYDTSGMGNGTDQVRTRGNNNSNKESDSNNDYNEEMPAVVDLTGHTLAGSMTMLSFQKKLIHHFNIAFKKCKVKWQK